MDGRVYDPRLGRFLSPDPYVQDPTYSQSLNRYSYVWNNPLRYTDPTGYRTWWDNFKAWGKKHKQAVVTGVTIVVAAAVTIGTAGTASPLLLAAIAGGAGGFAGGVAGSLIDGEKNVFNILGNGLLNGAIGAAAGYVGGLAGQWAVKGGISIVTGAGYNIASPVLEGAITGFLGGVGGGFAGGFVAGFGSALLSGADINKALEAGWKTGLSGAMTGGLIGSITGGYTAYKYAKSHGINPWTGKKVIPDKVYHYTNSSNTNSIDVEGIDPSADGYTYTTPEGDYTPEQAMKALNLDPAKGVRDAVYEIDVKSLINDGIIPIDGPTPVDGGSGIEVRIEGSIPAKYIRRIR